MHCPKLQSVARIHDPLAILGAIVFIFIMTFSAFQSSRSKGWFLWMMVLSTIFEAIGCATYAIHSQDPTNHPVFLASFTTTTIAPSFLAVSAFLLSSRYISSLLPREAATTRVRLAAGTSGLIICQCAIMIESVISLYHVGSYISPKPINGQMGALQRLAHHDEAVKLLFSSHIFQLVCFGIFTISTAYWTAKTSDRNVNEPGDDKKARQQMFGALSIINILCMFRSAHKIAEYLSVDLSAVQLVESRSDFWSYDALPVLFALVVLCSVFSKVEIQQQEPQVQYASIPGPEIKIVYMDEELHAGSQKA